MSDNQTVVYCFGLVAAVLLIGGLMIGTYNIRKMEITGECPASAYENSGHE